MLKAICLVLCLISGGVGQCLQINFVNSFSMSTAWLMKPPYILKAKTATTTLLECPPIQVLPLNQSTKFNLDFASSR